MFLLQWTGPNTNGSQVTLVAGCCPCSAEGAQHAVHSSHAYVLLTAFALLQFFICTVNTPWLDGRYCFTASFQCILS